MKLNVGNITLSYPIKRFDVSINHFTPRTSTAIEWAILEAAATVKRLPKYQDVTIDEFFSKIMQISDTNRLILPCLTNLMMGVNALEVDGEIHNGTDLSKVPMRCLRLTEEGEILQQRGLLPGEVQECEESFHYDICQAKILNPSEVKKVRLSNAPNGVVVVDDEIDAPLLQIREVLNKALEKPGEHYRWMGANTEIRDVSPIANGAESFWFNTPAYIEVDNNGKLTLSNGDSSVLPKVIDKIEAEQKNQIFVNVENANVGLTNDISALYNEKALSAYIDERMQKSDLMFVNRKFFTPTPQKIKKQETLVRISYGLDSFECACDLEEKKLEVKVPQSKDIDLLTKNLVYADPSNQLFVNNFTLSDGGRQYDWQLGYQSNSKLLDINAFLQTLVDLYLDKDNDILLLLLLSHQTELFTEKVKQVGSALKSIDEKTEFLRHIASVSTIFTRRTFISPSQESEVLFDNWIVQDIDETEAYKAVCMLKNNEFIKGNPERFKKGLNIIFHHLGKVKDIKRFWEMQKSILESKSMIPYMSDSETIKKLYTDDVVGLVFEQFGEIQKDQCFSELEKSLYALQNEIREFKQTMNQAGYKESLNRDEKLNIFINNPDVVLAANGCVVRIKQALSFLNNYLKQRAKSVKTDFIDARSFDENGPENFYNSLKMVRIVSDEITPYLGADAAGFNKIYVVDTSALMNNPGLIASFDKRKDALVVPMRVIEELNGLKDGKRKNDNRTEDEVQRAQSQAREAIRTIEAYQDKKWFFTEETQEHLLPADYPLKDANGYFVGDNAILSVALKYLTKEPILLVDDRDFGIKAKSLRMERMKSDDFMDTFSQKEKKK